LKIPDIIAFSLVGGGIVLLALYRLFVLGTGQAASAGPKGWGDAEPQNAARSEEWKDSEGEEAEQTETDGDVKDSGDGDVKESGEQDDGKFWTATFTGLLLSASDANDYMVISFLPIYFARRGISRSQSGAVFTALGVGTMAFAVLVPYVCTNLKEQKAGLWWALRGYQFTRIPLMFLIVMPNAGLFPFSFVIMLLVGLLYSFVEVCAFSWTCASVGPKDRTAAIATMLGGRVMGALFGPALGGILFNFAGFCMPFAVGFIILLVVQEVARQFFDSDDDESTMVDDGEDETPTRSGSMLRSPGVTVVQLINVLNLALLIGQIVFMQVHLTVAYHVPPWGISIIIVVSTLLIAVGLAGAPFLEEAVGPYIAMFVPMVFSSFSMLFMGPSPWLSFLPTDQLWVPLLGWGVGSASLGVPFAMAAAMPANIAIAAGWSEADAAIQTASLQTIVFGLGIAIGPVILNSIADAVGARNGCSYIFLLALLGFCIPLAILRALNPDGAHGEVAQGEVAEKSTEAKKPTGGKIK